MHNSIPRFFDKNLNAIARLYPGLATILAQPVTGREEPSPQPCPDPVLNPCAELHVLLQWAGSEVAPALFDQINRLRLIDPANRRLLLVENRPEVFRQAMLRRDWTALLESEICLLCVGEGEDVLRRFLHVHPFVAFATYQVYAGDLSCAAGQIKQTETILQAYQDQVKQALETTIRSQPSRRLPFPKRITFFTAGHNQFQDACVLALRHMGYDAQRLQWKSPLYTFIRAGAWVRACHDRPLDLLFFMNATPKTFCPSGHLADLPAAKLAWFVDNPARYITRPSDLDGCDGIGVFDRSYIPFLKTRTPSRVFEARTGYGLDPTQARPNPEWESINVAFVGELGTRGFLAIESALNQIAPGLVSLTSEILKTSEIRQPVDLSIIAQSILEDQGIPYRGAIVEYMENKATALRRRYYLDALSGMGLTVFGDAEWGGIHAGPLRACYAGRRLDYQTELPQLYASAKINLNIYHVQCIHAPNPRVYDVLACGGFLLTTYNPGLEDEFEIGRHLDVFHTKEELVEKVHYYLGQESKRREIAQQGQAHVLAKYGYHDRMQTFLHAIVRPEGDGYAYLRG